MDETERTTGILGDLANAFACGIPLGVLGRQLPPLRTSDA
jgi:hypothetical protein